MSENVYVRNLGSSSSGNSTLIWNENAALLVDMGFSQRYLSQKMEEAGLPFESLKAVLITHLHGDHLTPAMLNKALRYHVPVYIHQKLLQPLLKRFRPKSQEPIQVFDQNTFEIGPFTIKGFPVPHDASGGCFGFNVFLGPKKISIATDMGFPENGLADNFIDSDMIIIESNHDTQMLELSGRSQALIERIKTIGHLSNLQSVQFVEDVLKRSLKMPQIIALAHLSEDCNQPHLAEKGMQNLLKRLQLQSVRLQIFQKNQSSETLSV